MNKVRVSVGDHISEPSEVYIITGQSNGNLESYIIFYMLEPGIHVVYGCDQNPFAPTLKDEVLEAAIILVEEMGSILEEVPWETMTSDQRSAWIEKEILYRAPEIEELEEVEEIEAMEVIEFEDGGTEETELEEDPVLDNDESVVEVNEDEVELVLSESDPEEKLADSEIEDERLIGADLKPEDIDEDDVDGVDVDMEGVVVAEGDFDELLKQAFLKPDVAEKTQRKAAKRKVVKVEKEPVPEVSVDDEELSVAVESVEVEEALESSGEPEETVKFDIDQSYEDQAVDVVETAAGTGDSDLSEKDTRLKVIRFLSRF
jgi:hypothetical protein